MCCYHACAIVLELPPLCLCPSPRPRYAAAAPITAFGMLLFVTAAVAVVVIDADEATTRGWAQACGVPREHTGKARIAVMGLPAFVLLLATVYRAEAAPGW